jgi:hypothetical protein
MGRSRLEKKLSYYFNYPQGSADAAALAVADHWEGFEWVTGPVMVFWKRPGVGAMQVWAVSVAEGKGVIGHALAHRGIEPKEREWRTAVVTNRRFGKVATVRATSVAARAGSSGNPNTVILDLGAQSNET